jgi:hypothetical protein
MIELTNTKQEEIMRTIVVDPTGINNFHGSAPLTVRVSGETITGWDTPMYRISRTQAKRIENHFCGVSGCSCPAGGVVVELSPDGTEYGLRDRDTLSSAAAALGRKGGSAKSDRKAASSRENGKKGGRPKTKKEEGR